MKLKGGVLARIRKPIVYVFLVLLIFGAFFSTFDLVPPVKRTQAAGDTYFVDSTGGLDGNSGLSEGQAWKTVAKVNATSFNPGDSILFKRGETWREKLTVKNSGTAGNLITFGAYGSGANPKFNGSAQLDNASFSSQAATKIVHQSNTQSADQHDNGLRNYRESITSQSTSNTITLTFAASASANLVINSCAIGPRTNGNAASSMTRVTFGGGNNGTTILAGTTGNSDPLNFAVSNNSQYLIHIYFYRNFKYGSGGTGFNTSYYDSNAVDEALIATPGGGQLASNGPFDFLTSITGDNSTIWKTTTLPTYSISSLTSSGTTATVTTPSVHDLATNQYITVAGANPAGYNGTFSVTATDATHFTYTVAAGLLSPATGTITYSMVSPFEIWEDNLFLIQRNSITATAEAGSWYFDGTTLYINGWHQDNPVTNGRTYEVGHLAYGIYDNGKNYLEIKNIDSIQTYGGSDSSGNYNSSGMSGIYLQGNHSIVHDLTVYNTRRHSFSFYAGSHDNLAYNLTLHDDNGTTPVTIFGAGTTNNILQNSTIYSSQAGCASGLYGNGLLILHGTANGNIVQNIDFSVSGSSPAMIINSYDAGSDSNILRYNRIRGTFQRAIKWNGVNNNSIYDNVIEAQNAISYFAAIELSNASGTFVSNNTIIGSSSQYSVVLANSPNSLIKNNIFYGPKALSVDAASETGLASDYNDFYNGAGISWVWGVTTYNSFTDWKTNSNQDSHSLNINPFFVNASSDFHLQSTSPAINAGVDVGLTADFEGNPIVGVPDIGAYEYQPPAPSGSPTPSPTPPSTSSSSPSTTSTAPSGSHIVQTVRYYATYPLASFAVPTAQSYGLPFTFDASESFSTKGIVSYLWDFGDGETSSEMRVDHQYDKPGRYTVTLTVTDKVGKTATKTQTVDVKPPKPTIENIKVEDNNLIIEGKAYPLTMVSLTIHSNPISADTRSVNDGTWTYTVSNAKETLGAGDHTAFATSALVLADNTELKSEQSKTYDFQLSLDGDKIKLEEEKVKTWQYVSLGLALIIILGALSLFGLRKKLGKTEFLRR